MGPSSNDNCMWSEISTDITEVIADTQRLSIKIYTTSPGYLKDVWSSDSYFSVGDLSLVDTFLIVDLSRHWCLGWNWAFNL